MHRVSRTLLRRRAGLAGGAWQHAARPAGALRLARLGGVRFETSGDHNSGHIETAANEGVLFFNNVFPIKWPWLWRYSFWSDRYAERLHGNAAKTFDPVKVFEYAVPDSSTASIQSVTPRLKDGAAFLKFSHSTGTSATEIEKVVQDYLHENPERPAWNPFARTNVHLVKGRPWIEDLYRPPSCRLRVEFFPEGASQAPEISQEKLFEILRPYGKILEIQSQPSDSKVLPKYALVDFESKRIAISAKNCTHGIIVRDDESGLPIAKFKMAYERYSRTGWVRDWFFNHPRIVIPLLAALAALIASVVFDPLRSLFIKLHVNRTLSLADNRVYKWFAQRAGDILHTHSRRHDGAAHNVIAVDRRETIEQIEKWLMETADTFIIIQGPRGSGKNELVVEQALKYRKTRLVIDCKKIQDARGDAGTIDAMAQAVGYRPVFSWMNSISGLVDLAVQGSTGVKAGFSETLDGQVTKILNNTTSALRSLALDERKKQDPDAHMADDDYLEAHPEKRPVVVLDNYLHKSLENGIVYDKLAEWAANLTTGNIAHVIFLTTDVSFSKSLSKALPDRVFRQLSLGDLPADAAKRFVVSRLDEQTDEEELGLTGEKETALTASKRRKDLVELDGCISALGGRLTDLEFLARRIKAGESPSTAVREIIDQSASEILKMYVLGDGERGWSPQQAWALITRLAKAEGSSIRYSDAALDPAIAGAPAGADAVIAALEQAELVAVVSANGRPAAIRPGKPVFLPAFQRLVADRVLRARLDLVAAADQIKTANAAIARFEDELKLIGALPSRPAELAERLHWLLANVATNQRAVKDLERRSAELKKVLQTEF